MNYMPPPSEMRADILRLSRENQALRTLLVHVFNNMHDYMQPVHTALNDAHFNIRERLRYGLKCVREGNYDAATGPLPEKP